MRRAAIPVISALVLVASAVLLTGGRLTLQPPAANAQTEAPPQVGSWQLTLTDQSGNTTPILLTFTSDGVTVASELPIASAPLLPGPSEAPASPGESGAPASPGESTAPATEAPPTPTEAPATPGPSEAPASPSGIYTSGGQGIWTATDQSNLVFTYVVLQSDIAGTFLSQVTVSGTAALDDAGDALTGEYTMHFADPSGQDLGTSSGTLEGTRIQLGLFALFDASQVAGSLKVAFTDQSTGDPSDWLWDFGDGNTATDQNPTHTYAKSGDHTVTLTVSDDQGSDTTTQTITVTQVSKPAAQFTTDQTAGTLEIKFIDQTTGAPSAWSWTFGDGSNSTKQSPKHTYKKFGDFKVTLKASNAAGSSSVTKTITVAQAPTAAFTSIQNAGSFEIKFTDKSKGSPDTWNWTFGDGGTSTKPNPRHTYPKQGTYQVTLTVTNAAGTNSITQAVKVGPAATPSPSAAPSGG
jgi:PKD repeat protein